MLNIVLQIFFVLVLIVMIILVAFRVRKEKIIVFLPENYKELYDYVKFYRELSEEGKEKFEKRVEQFLSSVRITGANAEVEDLDRLLIAAGAIIPVYAIPDWQYVNLHEDIIIPRNI